MCPSRLPSCDESSSHRPSGMLDRDQRTAFTIDRIRGGGVPSIILTTTTTTTRATPYFTSNRMILKNSRLSSNHQCISSSVKGATIDTVEPDAKCSYLFGASKSSCKCKCECHLNSHCGIQWADGHAATIHLAKSYKTTRPYYRSRTKFVNYLLLFIFIWLATIHRTCAFPLPHPAMSSENENNDHDSERCTAIRNALTKPIEQSSVSAQYIRSLLNGYTQAQFKKQPIDVHEEWKKHPAHFHYSMGIEEHLPEDFDGEPSLVRLDHLPNTGIPSDEELTMEFQKIYICLQTLNKVFHEIRVDRTINETQIMHKLKNNVERHTAINHLFDEQYKYSNLDIGEVQTAMSALSIPLPEIEEVIINNKDRIIGEWIATRENLKALRYMRGVYNLLLQRCL